MVMRTKHSFLNQYNSLHRRFCQEVCERYRAIVPWPERLHMLQRAEVRLCLDALGGPYASAGPTQTDTDEVLQSAGRFQPPVSWARYWIVHCPEPVCCLSGGEPKDEAPGCEPSF